MKILLVDDSAAVTQLMSDRLRSYGHDVATAANGQQAVDKFQSYAPDLVLMDIEMPVMNGFQAANHIRAAEAQQKWAWTPIIFLTASDTVDNLITAIEAGGDDFMAKKLPEPVLQAKMKAMSRIAQLRQNLLSANRALDQMAHSDGLTGLQNRRKMDQHMDLTWERACNQHSAIAFVMIDIDNFKKYNDHYGHPAGDACLQNVARALQHTVDQANAEGWGGNALAARFGGEEFAVLLSDLQETDSLRLAQALVEAVRSLKLPHEKNAEWGQVTVSVGLAHLDHACGRLGALVASADAQLYRAKESGRNRAMPGALG